mmetsp:Transcript_9850/g.13935  ORF Transcript_9850/g.13935 Transcript_9850/m.13935 type:complete len:110 (-) Transcript_9850:484-813(-)|eukprot:CAMPEP_0184862748 /NCGR_PEP_ID=MMETSP0580-20130426/7581_1 /TAXON_ID=1118495 /ORGANISM="Dactyliosolen fragilissimus" /LENGTH=109 /DNA_ID=CAMNT_0027360727 /DNA_START=39 /DNA_END=368 /DNA_ORIENTATION=+
MATALAEWKEKVVCVVTCDGKIITGTLAGYDQLQNLILKDANERVYTFHSGGDVGDSEIEIVPLGLYMIRGDNVAIISDVRDEELVKQTVNGIQSESAEPIKCLLQFTN